MAVTMLNFKTRLIFICSVFILLQCIGGCASTSNFVFIHDKQDTTAYDIEWLSENIKEAATTLFDEGFDYNFKIVFPYQSYIKKISKNSMTASTVISKPDFNIEAQSTLKSLLTELQESPSYSNIFVITNVTDPSYDDLLLYNIHEQMQIKRTQVNFIFGTECCSKTIANVYRSITALSSNGFVMSADILNCGCWFAESIYQRIKFFPQKLLLYTFIYDETGTTHRPVNSFYETYMKKTLRSTDDPHKYELYSQKPYRTTLLNAAETDASVFNFAPPETSDDGKEIKAKYEIAFATGLSEDYFNFEYGFSAAPVRSLNETFRRPIKGSNNIHLSTNDQVWDHGFYRFQILFLNGSSFGEKKPLYLIQDSDVFTGSFEAPNNEYFFIEVTTLINATATVFRISTTAMKAVDKFGDDRNPAFEHNPAYKRKPVPFKWAEYSKNVAEHKSEDSQDTTNYSIRFYDMVCWIFGAAMLGIAIPCTPYLLSKIAEFSRRQFHVCCECGRKILQRLKSKKSDNQTVPSPNVDDTVADRKTSK